MADLALRLKIFIASPSDVGEERDIVDKAIDEMKEECARHRLLLQSYRWEKQGTPGEGAPQEKINRDLRTAELIIVIIGGKIGSIVDTARNETGTQQEFRLAGELVSKGRADDVFVYFRARDAGKNLQDSGLEQVRAFREELKKTNHVFFVDYKGTSGFRARIREDFRRWVERWYGVPDICDYTAHRGLPTGAPGEQLADNRASEVAQVFQVSPEDSRCTFLGRAAVDNYQNCDRTNRSLPVQQWHWFDDKEFLLDGQDEIEECSIGGQLVPRRPLVANHSEIYFSHSEWLFYFCAVGLVSRILEGDMQAVARRPYLNPVHQYFKILCLPHRPKIVEVLRRWLVNPGGITSAKPIVRNFSAYVLGTIGAIEAQDELAEAIRFDPGKDVKYYAIAALGKLRARRQLPVLIEVFNRALPEDAQFRDIAAQAICHTIGFLNYEF